MAIYDVKSLKAEEFINDGEILETIKYAEENKNNIELIDSILEKARPKKEGNGLHCTGLSHRDAAVLLACDIPEKVEEMMALANQIKQDFYGNRIVCIESTEMPFRKHLTSLPPSNALSSTRILPILP